MDREAPNVVGVRLERGDLFVRVVVEDAQLEVVRARDEPVLARDEAAAAHGDLRDLERLDERARVVVVDVDVAVVEADEEPWLGGVEVDRLDAVRPVELFALGTGSGAWAGQRGWRLTDTSSNIGFRRWIYGLSAVCGVAAAHPRKETQRGTRLGSSFPSSLASSPLSSTFSALHTLFQQ